MDALTTIHSVMFEADPYISVLGQPTLNPEYAELPAQWRDALWDLLNRPDSVRCWRCDAPAGYVLREQPDGFERIEWTPTGIAAEDDGPVAVLCEGCAPYIPEPPSR